MNWRRQEPLWNNKKTSLHLAYNRNCRNCQLEGCEESGQHFLSECPGLSYIKYKTLGRRIVTQLTDQSKTIVSKSKWFDPKS